MDFSVLAWRCIGIAEPVQVHGFTKSRLSLLSRQYRARLNGNGDGKKKSPSRYLFAHAVLSSAILRQNPQRVLAVDSGELRRPPSAVVDQIEDGPCGIRLPLDGPGTRVRQECVTTARVGRVRIDDGVATVQLVEDGLQ